MADRYERRLLEHLSHDSYTPSLVAKIMDDLGVPGAEAGVFGQTVARLAKAGKLAVDTDGKVGLPAMGEEVVGVFRKNPKGFGFVVPTVKVKEGDVFIPPEGVGSALTGDTVRVSVQRRRRNGEEDLVGFIEEVMTRKRQRFSGELRQQGTQWLVYPDGRELTSPVVVRDPHVKNARAGHKVVVEITAYPEGDMLPEGVITEVLGEAGLPSVETQAVIAAYNLPGDFDERVHSQARRATEQFEAELRQCEHTGWKDRDDLRDEFIITIDPPDAKDYDDAIHIKRVPEGWELGVHIADVAHFIPPGTPLDEEARKRGNSVYLPRHVIPMLPEGLSNGICSLQEGVPRYCKSCFMVYNRQGVLLRSGVAQVVIHSKKRLTYLEAQALIDGDMDEARKHAKTEPNYTEQLLSTLREMDACARAIRQRRREAGMIHLDLPEVELVYDDEGRVIDAEREDDAFTHTLIEMFMVEANEVLARLFQRVKVPLLRRIHPEPTPGDVDDLRTVARVAGFAIPKKPTRKELQTLLDGTKGTAAAPAVHFAVLRTLTKAEYSPAQIGHYALASEAYAHFTSPIRRYPDLTVHRALAAYLKATENGKNPPRTDEERDALGKALMESPLCPDEDTLVQIGKACTLTEVRAAEAEDSLRSFLVLQLLSQHVGESFRGMVTGCTNAGIFIRLDKYLADGFIKKEELPVGKEGRAGAWRLDQKSGALVNQASGRSFSIGDQVAVTIAKVDLALRKMDLVITDAESRDKGKSRKVYPKPGYEGLASPTGPVALGGGGLNIDWEKLKYGNDGSAARSRKSKQRDKGKTNYRRDK
ncbi:MAG: VacB/RNase II family 3'-5' exoribonuclease [Planctomycetaceae bacterium]|jgi:ribonuclease R|nr:VacB/RNase II family 3'-5' exoribonuclease [Phycisphaerales bacterium]MCE2653491.1 VacB/RNase II family 3'-5' exoribonuclease [Planctomycetaceae bacterium]